MIPERAAKETRGRFFLFYNFTIVSMSTDPVAQQQEIGRSREQLNVHESRREASLGVGRGSSESAELNAVYVGHGAESDHVSVEKELSCVCSRCAWEGFVINC